MILKLKSQFDEVAAAVGNDKQNVIERYKHDSDFCDALNFVFNPYIVTGLAKKKIEKSVQGITITSPDSLAEMIQYVCANNSGSDYVIAVVQHFIYKQDSTVHQFLKDFFTKDMQIGISHKTINKVLGKNFIPEHSIQLAKSYFDEMDKVKGDFAITLKLDGLRCTVFNDESGPKFISRKGLPFGGLVELESIFKWLPKGRVYDGELLAINREGLHSKDLFRKTQKIVKTEGNKTDIRFIAFDTLPIEEFLEGKSKKNYKERMEELNEILFDQADDLVDAVPCYYVGNNKDTILEILEHVISQGYEGLIVNTLNGKYQTKRTSDLLKVKKFKTVDLRIVGYEEYKHPGNLGALVVDYKGNKVNVGSGFTASDREQLWKVRDSLLGKIVEVKYFEESANQNGGISLRFPIFERMREDKDEISYN